MSRFGVVLIFSLSLSFCCFARDIKNPEIYRKLKQLRLEIEIISQFMGKVQVKDLPIVVRGTRTQSVYRQTAVLYNKVARLYFEHTLKKVPELPETPVTITPSNIYSVIELSLKQLLNIKQQYRIDIRPDEFVTNEKIELSDIYVELIQVSRQINNLLDISFRPSEVYSQIDYSIKIVSRMMDQMLINRNGKKEKVATCCRYPVDVYLKLLDTYRDFRLISSKLEYDLPIFAIKGDFTHFISPGDVHDLAIFVSDEIGYLAKTVGVTGTGGKKYVGRKFPFEVYAKVEFLSELIKLVKSRVGGD